jgi:hypothetical protein
MLSRVVSKISTPTEPALLESRLRPRRWEILAAFLEGSPASDRHLRRLLVVLLALICLCATFVGVPRLAIFGHDVFVSLDGGWRVLNGQRPGVDFYSQMGPAYFLLHATGMWLAGGDARGLGYGSALAATVLSGWAFLLLRSRMKPFPLLVACLFLALLVAAPFPLGFSPLQTAFCMKHNRYCYMLTALVMLESFLPPGEFKGWRHAFFGGFSSGVACALALFTKISFGFVALTFAAASLLLTPRARYRLPGLAAGFLAFSLPMMGYLRFNLRAQIEQYRLLAVAHGSAISLKAIVAIAYRDRLEMFLIALLVLLTGFLLALPLKRHFVLAAVTLMAGGADFLLLLTNTQLLALPLLATCMILLVNEIATAHQRERTAAEATLLAIVLLPILLPASLDALGMVVAAKEKIAPSVPVYRLSEPHLAALAFSDCYAGRAENEVYCHPNDNGRFYVASTQDGLNLIRRYGRPQESVVGLDLSNPFSYGSLRAPAHGGAVVLHETDIDPDHVPPRNLLIGDASLLLIPKFKISTGSALPSILRAYPEILGRDYRLVAETDFWSLYRKVQSD